MSEPSVFRLEREILTLVERIVLEFAAAQAERLRVNRWWVTYNAALSGYTSQIQDAEWAHMHEWCAGHADLAHGSLKKP